MSYNAIYEKIIIDKEIMKLLKEQNANEDKIKHCEEKLIKHKREWRDWLKKQDDHHFSYYKNGFTVNGGGEWEYCWTKVFFPGEHWTKEEMKEFEDENWKRCRYSAYDCTGDIFTYAIDCFNVPSGVVCYIREAMDV